GDRDPRGGRRRLSQDRGSQDHYKHQSEKSGSEGPVHLGPPRRRSALPWKLSRGSSRLITVCTAKPCTPRNFYCIERTNVKKKSWQGKQLLTATNGGRYPPSPMALSRSSAAWPTGESGASWRAWRNAAFASSRRFSAMKTRPRL